MTVFTQLGTTWFVARRAWTWVWYNEQHSFFFVEVTVKQGTKTCNSDLLCNITERRIEGDVARFTYSRINITLSWNKLSFCTLLKVVAKNRTIPFSLCNLQQPDLCLICGRLNVQHRFSTRSALESGAPNENIVQNPHKHSIVERTLVFKVIPWFCTAHLLLRITRWPL